MMRNSDQGVVDPEVASVVPSGWAVDEGGQRPIRELARKGYDYSRTTDPRGLWPFLQEVFEKPA